VSGHPVFPSVLLFSRVENCYPTTTVTTMTQLNVASGFSVSCDDDWTWEPSVMSSLAHQTAADAAMTMMMMMMMVIQGHHQY